MTVKAQSKKKVSRPKRKAKGRCGYTPYKEKFAQLIVEGKSQVEAYRGSRPDSTASDKTIINHAYALTQDQWVIDRIAEIRKIVVEKVIITVEDLIEELEEARQSARESPNGPQASAMVAATMGKAKLLGFGVENVKHSGSVSIDVAKLTDKELDDLIAEQIRKIRAT